MSGHDDPGPETRVLGVQRGQATALSLRKQPLQDRVPLRIEILPDTLPGNLVKSGTDLPVRAD